MSKLFAFSILYEDRDLLAIAKPEGLAAVPERDPSQECLLSIVAARLDGKVYVVHRLDKEASGAILFAKNPEAHRYLNEQFSNRQVRKTYLALAHGIIAQEGGRIEQPIRQFGSGRMGVDWKQGKPCLTEFRVEERLTAHTLVRAYPITGRRHQLRVHFYSLGHPLVGDPQYGDGAVQRAFPRLMLHAWRLECCLPSGQPLVVEAPIPASFAEVLRELREDPRSSAEENREKGISHG